MQKQEGDVSPALLPRSETRWLIACESDKQTDRYMRYRINRKLAIFYKVELPLLQDKGSS